MTITTNTTASKQLRRDALNTEAMNTEAPTAIASNPAESVASARAEPDADTSISDGGRSEWTRRQIDYRPLKIGDLEIGFPIVQAALSGYSDWPMRKLAREYGASYTLCEVMLDQFLVNLKDRNKNRHFLYNTSDEQPVAGQLMGAEPEQFSRGAERLAAAGFAVIDINFGCPVKKVLGRCRGGFHLSQPEVALEIIRRTRDVVPDHIPVTVKMRRGIDDSSESTDNFHRIFEGGFAAGLAAATVHGRTVHQRYNGPSRWQFLKDLKDSHPDKVILGSGDLFTAVDCWNMIEQTGVDGVTVARGAIGNPWIFEQAKRLAAGEEFPSAPTIHEQRAALERHWELSAEVYGEKRAAQLLRKFGIKYSSSHPNYVEVRPGFARVRSQEDWRAVLDTHYSTDGPGVFPPLDVHRVQGSGCNS